MDPCPRCTSGLQTKRVGKNGPFLACGNFPECKWTGSLPVEERIAAALERIAKTLEVYLALDG